MGGARQNVCGSERRAPWEDHWVRFPTCGPQCVSELRSGSGAASGEEILSVTPTFRCAAGSVDAACIEKKQCLTIVVITTLHDNHRSPARKCQVRRKKNSTIAKSEALWAALDAQWTLNGLFSKHCEPTTISLITVLRSQYRGGSIAETQTVRKCHSTMFRPAERTLGPRFDVVSILTLSLFHRRELIGTRRQGLRNTSAEGAGVYVRVVVQVGIPVTTSGPSSGVPQAAHFHSSRCAVPEVGATLPRQTERRPRRADHKQMSDFQSKRPRPASAAFSCHWSSSTCARYSLEATDQACIDSGLEFLVTAHVPVNWCTAPRRHGRITRQLEEVPYGGFRPDLPWHLPLSHGSPRFDRDLLLVDVVHGVQKCVFLLLFWRPSHILAVCAR